MRKRMFPTRWGHSFSLFLDDYSIYHSRDYITKSQTKHYMIMEQVENRKSIPVTSRELTEVYYALAKRVEYYEEYYDLKDDNFRSEYGEIYSSYLNAKNAFKKVQSMFFG